MMDDDDFIPSKWESISRWSDTVAKIFAVVQREYGRRMEERGMEGYKAYNHGLVCRGKQYEVGQTYEEPKAEISKCGMHYCDNPADLMFYNDLIDGNGEFTDVTEVEDLAPETTQSHVYGVSKMYCTTKLKIGKKLSYVEWIDEAVSF